MCRALAYWVQDRAGGGLTTDARRHLARWVGQLERGEEIAAERDVVLKTGTRLACDWHGKTHHVPAPCVQASAK